MGDPKLKTDWEALQQMLTAGKAPENKPTGFSGVWNTSFGKFAFEQKGKIVQGTCQEPNYQCAIQGVVDGKILEFEYTEATVKGTGRFILESTENFFHGIWRENDSSGPHLWRPWRGVREWTSSSPQFEGLWQSTFGLMRITQVGNEVIGTYGDGMGVLNGQVAEEGLSFRYQERSVKGEGQFVLAKDGSTFAGHWREDGKEYHEWIGQRQNDDALWLVILEHNMERNVSQLDWSVGSAIKSIFSYRPNLQIRYRHFSDWESVAKWCWDLAFLNGRVILYIAAHGTDGGIQMGSKLLTGKMLGSCLPCAGNLHHVHISSCCATNDGFGQSVYENTGRFARFGLSGFSTSVENDGALVADLMLLSLLLKGVESTGRWGFRYCSERHLPHLSSEQKGGASAG